MVNLKFSATGLFLNIYFDKHDIIHSNNANLSYFLWFLRIILLCGTCCRMFSTFAKQLSDFLSNLTPVLLCSTTSYLQKAIPNAELLYKQMHVIWFFICVVFFYYK